MLIDKNDLEFSIPEHQSSKGIVYPEFKGKIKVKYVDKDDFKVIVPLRFGVLVLTKGVDYVKIGTMVRGKSKSTFKVKYNKEEDRYRTYLWNKVRVSSKPITSHIFTDIKLPILSRDIYNLNKVFNLIHSIFIYSVKLLRDKNATLSYGSYMLPIVLRDTFFENLKDYFHVMLFPNINENIGHEISKYNIHQLSERLFGSSDENCVDLCKFILKSYRWDLIKRILTCKWPKSQLVELIDGMKNKKDYSSKESLLLELAVRCSDINQFKSIEREICFKSIGEVYDKIYQIEKEIGPLKIPNKINDFITLSVFVDILSKKVKELDFYIYGADLISENETISKPPYEYIIPRTFSKFNELFKQINKYYGVMLMALSELKTNKTIYIFVKKDGEIIYVLKAIYKGNSFVIMSTYHVSRELTWEEICQFGIDLGLEVNMKSVSDVDRVKLIIKDKKVVPEPSTKVRYVEKRNKRKLIRETLYECITAVNSMIKYN